MSDGEAKAIRASCYELAAILIEDWRDKRAAAELALKLQRGVGRPTPSQPHAI